MNQTYRHESKQWSESREMDYMASSERTVCVCTARRLRHPIDDA